MGFITSSHNGLVTGRPSVCFYLKQQNSLDLGPRRGSARKASRSIIYTLMQVGMRVSKYPARATSCLFYAINNQVIWDIERRYLAFCDDIYVSG